MSKTADQYTHFSDRDRMLEIISSVCNEFQFCDAACVAFKQAYLDISVFPAAVSRLEAVTSLFWADFYRGDGEELAPLDEISEISGIHRFTVYELFYILCIPDIKEKYELEKIPDSIFHATFSELRYKMEITYRIYGVWGCKYADWYKNFFLLRRFCFGRLEFELVKSKFDYTRNGNTVHKGDAVINVHIPEAGPLKPEEVLQSYNMAVQFYGPCFASDTIPFQCESWILYPAVSSLYPEGNLKKFASDFEIIESEQLSAESDDRWRIFQVPPDTPVPDYPEDTTLQRSIKSFLLAGNQMGISTGIFFRKKDGFSVSSHNFRNFSGSCNAVSPSLRNDKLYGKVLICDGDSIGEALTDKPFYKNGWWGRLEADYSITGKNYCTGGGTITSGLYYEDESGKTTPRHWISTNIDHILADFEDLDYLILEGGTNDADLLGNALGEFLPEKFGTYSPDDFSGNYDTTTFCGAAEYMFYKALSYWPRAKTGLIIAMEMEDGLIAANRRKYYDTLTEIAGKWHIPVLDLWNTSQMDARLKAYYDPDLSYEENVIAKKCYYDGQHLTSYGYDLLQQKIDSWIHSL